MRNPDRIDPFLKRLGDMWKKVPDWRFGQLISNVIGTLQTDPFFPEDDEMIEHFENFFKQLFKNGD